jgi:hypothetical protein
MGDPKVRVSPQLQQFVLEEEAKAQMQSLVASVTGDYQFISDSFAEPSALGRLRCFLCRY